MVNERLESKVIGEKSITVEIRGKKVKGVFDKKYRVLVNSPELLGRYSFNIEVDKSIFERLKVGTKYSMTIPVYENNKIGEFTSTLDFKFE